MTDAAKKRNVAVWLLMVLARMHTDSINGLFPIQVISCGEARYGENHSRKVIGEQMRELCCRRKRCQKSYVFYMLKAAGDEMNGRIECVCIFCCGFFQISQQNFGV